MKTLALIPTVEHGLNGIEKARLAELERVIDEGKRSFLTVGNALIEIRKKTLYRATGTFEEYVKERFGFQRAHAYRLQGAAYCAEIVSHGRQADLTERTLRPLTRLIDLRKSDEPTAEQTKALIKVWHRAEELAGEGSVNGTHVAAAISEIRPSKSRRAEVGRYGVTAADFADELVDRFQAFPVSAFDPDGWRALELRLRMLVDLCKQRGEEARQKGRG